MELKKSSVEISPGIFRLSVAPSSHFEFAQFLIVDEKTCLIHAGKAKLFEPLLGMVKDIMGDKDLDHIVFSHVEADESGAVNHWLEEFQNAEVVCNKVANINLDDFLVRPANVIRDGEIIELGKRSLKMIETPHFPHNWDAHMWMETTDNILFSSDFCCQGGICEPVVETNISDSIISFYDKGKFIPYGSSTNGNLEKLAALPIRAIAPMHGSTIVGPIVKTVFENVKEDLVRRS